MSNCRCGSRLCSVENQLSGYANQIRYYRAALERGFYPGQQDRPFDDRQRASIVNAINSYESEIRTWKAEQLKIIEQKRVEKMRNFLAAKIVLEPNLAERKKKVPPARAVPFDWAYVPPIYPSNIVPDGYSTVPDPSGAIPGCNCAVCETHRQGYTRQTRGAPEPTPDNCGSPTCSICNPNSQVSLQGGV